MAENYNKKSFQSFAQSNSVVFLMRTGCIMSMLAYLRYRFRMVRLYRTVSVAVDSS